jgi:hypothetical protein
MLPAAQRTQRKTEWFRLRRVELKSGPYAPQRKTPALVLRPTLRRCVIPDLCSDLVTF